MTELLMPKATAVWLVDNTSLTFDQIGDFCSLHPLEVKAIADGDSAQGIKGLDPLITGQLSRDELAKAQEDPNHKLTLAPPKVRVPTTKKKKARYTPVSRRQDRPNAIFWLVRNHPELKDSQIIKLVGTTKPTITAIREGNHWNSANLQAMDPVTLGLCTQIALDGEVKKAAANTPAGMMPAPEPTLLPTEQTYAPEMDAQPDIPDNVFGNMPSAAPVNAPEEEEQPEYDPDSVFASLSSLKKDDE